MFRAGELLFGGDITRRENSASMKNHSRTRIILFAAGMAALVVPLLASTARQQTVRVESSFVQLDAMVTDKNGNRILGLKPENFHVLEDNVSQKIAAVDFFDVSKTVADVNEEPIYVSLNSANDSQTLSAIRSSHRLIVLFFDKSAMFPEDLLRSVGSAKEFVKNQMTSADLVTIATYGTQLVVKSDFTNDRATLDDALESLISGKRSAPKGMKATLDDSANGDTGVTDTLHSLNAAASLAEMLAQIPGRKSVIHFTGGLSPRATLGHLGPSSAASVPMDRGVPNPGARATAAEPDIIPNVDTATNAANDSNASFYEVDARGLVTICGGMPCSCSTTDSRPCQPVYSSRDTLYTLAADSGGMLFTDLNDFRPIYKAVQDDSTGYYLLTYDPSNKKKDGSYRIIEIKLVNVPGGHVAFRHGYYAPRK
jgi:VWFA-related protein